MTVKKLLGYFLLTSPFIVLLFLLTVFLGFAGFLIFAGACASTALIMWIVETGLKLIEDDTSIKSVEVENKEDEI